MYLFIAFALVFLLTGIAFLAVTSNRSDNRYYNQRPLQTQISSNFDAYQQNPFSNFNTRQTKAQRPDRFRSRDASGAMIVAMLTMLGALAFVVRYDQDAKSIAKVETVNPELPNAAIKITRPLPDSNTLKPAGNPLLIPQETPDIAFEDTETTPKIQAKGVPRYQVYWVVWLNAYPTLEEATRLQRAFIGRPIRLALLPDGRYLAFIHYDNPNDNVLCSEDVNKHLSDLRPFGIYTARIVKNIGPVE
ncbi:MAG: hypothetical protein WCR52_00440 [Bacteroidota bacterium]